MRNKPCLASADVQNILACEAEAAKNKWPVPRASIEVV